MIKEEVTSAFQAVMSNIMERQDELIQRSFKSLLDSKVTKEIDAKSPAEQSKGESPGSESLFPVNYA